MQPTTPQLHDPAAPCKHPTNPQLHGPAALQPYNPTVARPYQTGPVERCMLPLWPSRPCGTLHAALMAKQALWSAACCPYGQAGPLEPCMHPAAPHLHAPSNPTPGLTEQTLHAPSSPTPGLSEPPAARSAHSAGRPAQSCQTPPAARLPAQTQGTTQWHAVRAACAQLRACARSHLMHLALGEVRSWLGLFCCMLPQEGSMGCSCHQMPWPPWRTTSLCLQACVSANAEQQTRMEARGQACAPACCAPPAPPPSG